MRIKRRQFIQGTTGMITAIGASSGCASAPSIRNTIGHSKQDNFVLKGLKRTPPSDPEYLAYRERFSNWGRWGKEDRLGTLNFITKEVVRNANLLVKHGRHVSLGRPVTNSDLSVQVRKGVKWGNGTLTIASDRISIKGHGYIETHIDALCHVYSIEDSLYNGAPGSDVSEQGTKSHGIENWANGIVTRGVVYDIPRLRNVNHITIDQPVHGWELEDFARKEKIQPRTGDAVIVHCGRNDYFKSRRPQCFRKEAWLASINSGIFVPV